MLVLEVFDYTDTIVHKILLLEETKSTFHSKFFLWRKKRNMIGVY